MLVSRFVGVGVGPHTLALCSGYILSYCHYFAIIIIIIITQLQRALTCHDSVRRIIKLMMVGGYFRRYIGLDACYFVKIQ